MHERLKVPWTDLETFPNRLHCHRAPRDLSKEGEGPDTIFLCTGDAVSAITIYLTPAMVAHMANTMLTDDERSQINVPVAAEAQ